MRPSPRARALLVTVSQGPAPLPYGDRRRDPQALPLPVAVASEESWRRFGSDVSEVKVFDFWRFLRPKSKLL